MRHKLAERDGVKLGVLDSGELVVVTPRGAYHYCEGDVLGAVRRYVLSADLPWTVERVDVPAYDAWCDVCEAPLGRGLSRAACEQLAAMHPAEHRAVVMRSEEVPRVART